MRRLLILSLLSICYTSGIARGGYTIDGNLSDWGVTLYTDWVPNGTADYEQTDNINKYNAKGFSELYDYEAMYFDCDPENLYFAVVSSYPLGNHKSIAGDLGFDLDGYGLGWLIYENNFRGHDGATPGYLANMFINENEKGSFGVILMFNRGISFAFDIELFYKFYPEINQILLERAEDLFY